MSLRIAAVVGLLALTAFTAGCVGPSTRNLCVDSASSSGNTATIKGEGGTFTYSDPSGLVNSNWKNPGVYVITVDNNVITQTLKAFTYNGGCPLVGGS
jgi:hypothetical protein